MDKKLKLGKIISEFRCVNLIISLLILTKRYRIVENWIYQSKNILKVGGVIYLNNSNTTEKI